MSYHERDWYDREERKRAAARLSASSPVPPPPNPYKDALRVAARRPGVPLDTPAPPSRFLHLPSWILGALCGGWLVYFFQRFGPRVLAWLAVAF